MPDDVRTVLIAFSLAFMAVGVYHRLRALTSEKIDHSKEGWGIFFGIRLGGFTAFGSTAVWLWKPSLFRWAAFPVPDWVRWIGVAGFGLGTVWLMWMFVSLGSNLTDTVVTRKDAYFVERGPYRYVRNPMYVGILMLGLSLGLALGTWLVPVAATVMFLFLARRTRKEEMYLLAKFGEQYRGYMSRVGRFFPRSG